MQKNQIYTKLPSLSKMVTLAEGKERLTCGSSVFSSTKKTSFSSKTASFSMEMLIHNVSAEVNISCVPGKIGVKSTVSMGQREIKYELMKVVAICYTCLPSAVPVLFDVLILTLTSLCVWPVSAAHIVTTPKASDAV